MSDPKEVKKRPMGRRELMMARQQKKKVDANLLFNKETTRQRHYNLPFFQTELKKYIRKRYELNMSIYEQRKFELIKLDNELEILLVQDTDPKATHAACAMAVNAGYFSDPDEMPGLAHLTEHMMFLGGNDTFEPGELAKFVSSVGGTHNAYTVAEETNYHFDVPYTKPIYEAALDRFTSSFVKPTFTAEGIKNESEVIDNEYAKNIGDPMRSVLELLRGNSNPKHPFSKFSCGNYHTLYEVPAEKQLDIPSYLDEFFLKHYSANRMKAVLIAPCDLGTLKELAKKHFSKIENFNTKPDNFMGSPYTEKEHFTRFDVITHKDENELLLSFPFENFDNFDTELPQIYLSQALASRAPGCLIDYLDEKGWANSVSAFPMQCANHCVLFWVQIKCTEEGIWDHVEDIIHAFFIYISKLYHTGLGDEFINNIAEKVCKQHAQSIDKYAYRFGQNVASHMLVAKKENIITHGAVPYRFDHESFLRVCEAIRPEKLTVVVSHKGAEAVADKQEPFYKAHYMKSKLDPSLLERFNRVDPKISFEVPKPIKEKKNKNDRIFRFEQPKPFNVRKLVNLPEGLENNPILKAKTQFFVYINRPKDEDLDAGKLDKKEKTIETKDEGADPPPPPEGDIEAGGDEDDPGAPSMRIITNHCNCGEVIQGARVRAVKDFADGDEDGVGTIDTNKKKKAKGFMERGVINGGAANNAPKKKPAGNNKVRKIGDELADANELNETKAFAFASKDVGKLVELDARRFFKPPLPDMFRPPLLLKANDKSLLFLKQNVPTSMDNFTSQCCVDVYVYPKFLAEYSASPRDRAIFSFYMYFVSTSLSSYSRKMQYEHNVKFSVSSTSQSIVISIKGYDLKVFDICRQIFDEMQRIHNFKWHRFERYKKILLSGSKDIRRSPRNVCSTHMNFFTMEPNWMYRDIDEALKKVKLRDVQKFAEKVFHGCNMQVVIVGNATPPQAIEMFDLLENSLKRSDNSKMLFNSFPVTKRVLMEPNVEAFYVEHTSDIFKDDLYEFKVYHEDNNSGYHCMLQVGDMTQKKRATLSLLGTLIDSPCNERIRTEERVGYLIHSRASAGGITGTLEFMFQSNAFGPFTIDEKLERFLNDYLAQLEKYTKGDLIKAKKGIAAPYLKPAQSVAQEADYWSGYVASGSYDFDSAHRFVNELWKVTLEDVVEFYKSYILPNAPERRKLVVGVTCGPHYEADEKSKALKMEQGNVEIITDPYEFKYAKELVTRKPFPAK